MGPSGFLSDGVGAPLKSHLDQVGFLSNLVWLMLKGLLWPIWAKWVSIRWCWGSFKKSFGPSWIFIESCWTHVEGSIMAYLGQVGFYQMVLGLLKKVIWTKFDFYRILLDSC